MNRTYHAIDCDSDSCPSDQTLHDAIIAADNARADGADSAPIYAIPRAYTSPIGAAAKGSGGTHPAPLDRSQALRRSPVVAPAFVPLLCSCPHTTWTGFHLPGCAYGDAQLIG